MGYRTGGCKIIFCKDKPDTIKVGDLEYGTYFHKVSSGGKSIYKKLDGKKLSTALRLEMDEGLCLIENIEYGTFRAVSEESLVEPLMVELHVRKAKVHEISTLIRR